MWGEDFKCIQESTRYGAYASAVGATIFHLIASKRPIDYVFLPAIWMGGLGRYGSSDYSRRTTFQNICSLPS